MASEALTVGLCCKILLYYLDTILSVHPIGVVPETTTGARQSRVSWEESLALYDVLQ